MTRKRLLLAMTGLLVLLPLLALAASAAMDGFRLDWRAVPGGGGRATSASFGLDGTVGQSPAGLVSGPGYQLGAGFAYGLGGPGAPVSTPTATSEHGPTATATKTSTPRPPGAVRLYLPILTRDYAPSGVDGFDPSTLSTRWSWVNEDAALWSLTARPGFLRLVTHSGRFHDKNVALMPMTAGDVEISTRLLFAPTQNVQMAGLVLWQDSANYVVILRCYCDSAAMCVGNGIYFDWITGGTAGGHAVALATAQTDEAYLRLLRRQGQVSGYYSADGVAWTLVGSYTPPAGSVYGYGGLSAARDLNDARIPADFDWFRWGAVQ